MPRYAFPLERFATLPTPFYYYDTHLLEETLSSLRGAIASDRNFHVHYAVKANTNIPLLRRIAAARLGADCVSGGEIEIALSAGFPADKIVYAGVGKTDDEIRLGLNAGISCFNVESVPELEVINQLATQLGKRARCAFRINPNVDAHTHEKITTGLSENKFGIDMSDMEQVIRRCQSLPAVEYAGLHFHIGSQITEMEVYAALCRRINALQEQLDRAGIVTPSINVGGGLGIDYSAPDAHPIPPFADYFNVFRTHLRLRAGQALHFELGRSIVAQCGTLVARTLYVKEGIVRKFVIVDAGFTDLIRPALYGAHHFTQNLTSNLPHETYDVVGPICESSDVFGCDLRLPQTHRGDLIAFRSAGAYGEVMASTYNARKLPQAYYAQEV